MAAQLNSQTPNNLPFSPTTRDDGTHNVPLNRPNTIGSSLTVALAQRQHDPQSSPTNSPIHKAPIETLSRIFGLLAPPRTRHGVYTLSKLTHVCHFWRVALINKPQAWATIFATQNDRRSFVEMCLERSYPVSLEVTVDAHDQGSFHQPCTCKKDRRLRLVPNENKPCEWHFVFEPLAEPRHSGRIHVLNILFDFEEDYWYPTGEKRVPLALGGCRFFNVPPLPLTSLRWIDPETRHADYLFSTPPFVPTLRSVSFRGSWNRGQIAKVNNLTSVTLTVLREKIDAESFRTFILNNKSLETLSLDFIKLEGGSKEPPLVLSNLKCFNACYDSRETFSTIFRIPAFQRLSSLVISTSLDVNGDGIHLFTLCATGDGIALTIRGHSEHMVENWQDLTKYARPTIRHVRLENPDYLGVDEEESNGIATLFIDAHTMEIGRGHAHFYTDFWDDLKELGPQLKTIRFEIPEETEPFRDSDPDYGRWGGEELDCIADLVTCRFERGRPFSSIERMVVNGGERVNRQQDFVWRCFYNDRSLNQFVRPE